MQSTPMARLHTAIMHACNRSRGQVSAAAVDDFLFRPGLQPDGHVAVGRIADGGVCGDVCDGSGHFVTVIVAGMLQFGFVGFFLNQIPGMDLPWYMAIVIKPMILAIELLGLCIKHGVLAVRLLANMVAGHLVILGIMGLAFGAEAALAFSAGEPGWQWGLTAVIAVVGLCRFQRVGTVCRLPAGVHFHLFVGPVYRRSDSQALTPTHSPLIQLTHTILK